MHWVRVLGLAQQEGGEPSWYHDLDPHAVYAWIVGACLADAVANKYRDQLVGMIPVGTLADGGLAQGWHSRRFEGEGWPWLDGILARDLTADQQAAILLASRDYPKAWEVVNTRGAAVADAFWRRFSMFGLGHGFGHVTKAARWLVQAGRVSAALKLTTVTWTSPAMSTRTFSSSCWLVRRQVPGGPGARARQGLPVPSGTSRPAGWRRARAAGHRRARAGVEGQAVRRVRFGRHLGDSRCQLGRRAVRDDGGTH